MTRGQTIGVVAGVLMLLLGGLWTLQGLGYVEGSPMTGEQTWAIIGPIVAGVGVAAIIVALQRR
ncbi:hypothetical protein [Nocardioides limicola]|uniref:hypothetical protein n=1 Tax=Nocardioides limicola TaxID=2803368 RepID=UPI00193AE820|nr:hypothetical protein [Nocardioides sp. DJM-14]